MKAITLTEGQTQALAEWAKEGARTNGCTAWGPRFNAAMDAAIAVLDQAEARGVPSGFVCDACGHLVCATCGQAITSIDDCWVEWKKHPTTETNGDGEHYGLRIVHRRISSTFHRSPHECGAKVRNDGCCYNAHDPDLRDIHLSHFRDDPGALRTLGNYIDITPIERALRHFSERD